MPGSGLRGLVATEDIPAGESAIAVPAALCVQLGSAASQGAVRLLVHCVLACHWNPGILMHSLFLLDNDRSYVMRGPAWMRSIHYPGQKLYCYPMASTCFG